MKKIVVIILCSFVCMAAFNLAQAKLEPIDTIVAYVNDDVITQSEVDQEIKMVHQQIEQSHTPMPPENVLRKQVLERLININIQLQLAKKAGVTISNQQLTKALTTIAERNHVNLATMRQKITQQGLDYKQYCENIRRQLLLQTVQQQAVAKKIVITPEEFKAFRVKYQDQKNALLQYHVSDILISLPDTPSTQVIQAAEKRAHEVLDKINHGTDFSAAAIAGSQGENALQGGDLGWRKAAELPQIFADKIEKMKVGEVAGPIRAENGFHIIKLVATRAENQTGNSHLSDAQLHEMLFNRKVQQALMTWIQDVRSQAYIKIVANN